MPDQIPAADHQNIRVTAMKSIERFRETDTRTAYGKRPAQDRRDELLSWQSVIVANDRDHLVRSGNPGTPDRCDYHRSISVSSLQLFLPAW